jgi:hypothetical protein
VSDSKTGGQFSTRNTLVSAEAPPTVFHSEQIPVEKVNIA